MNNRESSIKQALEAIENGTSESKAAKDYNIPRPTSYNRRAGRTDTEHGHTNQQRLSPKQEDELCRWIVEQEARGYAPSHKRVRETAVLMLEVSGDDEPLGKRWVQNFLKRNPRVATLLGKPIESSRIRGTQPEQINVFYKNFNSIRTRINV